MFTLTLILIASLLFRIVRSFHDGISLRAPGVGWWSWHIVNWLGRDVLLAYAYIYVFLKAPNDSHIYDILIQLIVLNYWLHQDFYNLGIKLRRFLPK